MRFIFGGDIAVRYNNDYRGLVEIISGLKDKGSFFVANFESTMLDDKVDIAPINKYGPNVMMCGSGSELVSKLPIDLYSVANNHIGDYGAEGIVLTAENIVHMGFEYIGIENAIGKDYDGYPVLHKTFEYNISIISVCENEFGTSRKGVMGSCGYSYKRMKRTISQEKEWADFIFVIFHGGIENYPFPTPNQKDRYHQIVDMGADAVIGMHSHCPVGYELYCGKPIIYGTGNLIFPQEYQPLYQSWNYGYIASICIGDSGLSFEAIPYRSVYTGNKFEFLNEKWIYDYLKELCEYTLDDELLQELLYAWAELKGPLLSQNIKNNSSVSQMEQLCFMRNIFTCEAHNEVMTAYYDMEYAKKNNLWNYDLEQAKKIIKKYISIDHYHCDTSSTIITNVLWGFGELSCKKFKELTDSGISSSEILIVDKDLFKQGLFYFDNAIMSPYDALIKYVTADWYICTPKRYVDEIMEELVAYGITRERIHEN